MAKPKDLVAEILAVPKSKHSTWFDGLDEEKQAVVLAVREQMPKRSGIYQTIAKRLIERLGISVTPQTVALWLKKHE